MVLVKRAWFTGKGVLFTEKWAWFGGVRCGLAGRAWFMGKGAQFGGAGERFGGESVIY